MKQPNNIRIAITNDTRILRCRLLVKLLKMCGATPVLIPQTIQRSVLEHQKKEEVKNNPAEFYQRAIDKHLIHVKEILATCNGLVLPGNRQDVPPQFYGQHIIHPETEKRLPKNQLNVRFETEVTMARYALKANWPIIGICGGMQLVNVVLNGSLVQHLPDDERIKKGKIPHRDVSLKKLSVRRLRSWEQNFENHISTGHPINIFHATHGMKVAPDSLLADIYREVNPGIELNDIGELSIHHQGCFVENLGDGLRPVATAPDGLVEAAELTSYNTMCLLTQFHLECNVSGMAEAVIRRLVKAAKN